MGGRGPMRPIGDAAQIDYLTAYAGRLWPQLGGVAWTHGWNSRLAITKDHWPHVHEPTENALIYLGCNGRGVALATAMGKQLAGRLMGGRDFEMDMPISLVRPIAGHMFWRQAVTAAVLHGRAMDWMGR